MARSPVESTLDNAAAHFQRDGYIVIRDFWTQRQTQCMLENLQRYVREVMPSLPPEAFMLADKTNPDTLFRLEKMDLHDDWFERLNHDDRITSLVKKLLDDELVYQRVAFFGKLPRGGEATPPHQDGYYFKITPNEAITCWVPLDVTDEANGCMRYIPGSHRLPMREHVVSKVYGFSLGIDNYGEKDLDEEVAVSAKPGDLLLHHSRTVHRADANNSERNRRSLGLVYFAQRAKRDVAAIEAHQKRMNAEWAQAGKR